MPEVPEVPSGWDFWEWGFFYFGLEQKIPGVGDQGFGIQKIPSKKSPMPGMGIWDFRGRKFFGILWVFFIPGIF